MSMAELMREVSGLEPERQRELAAFLLHLRLQHDAAWRTEMTRRIDDKNPANWLSPAQLKTELNDTTERLPGFRCESPTI